MSDEFFSSDAAVDAPDAPPAEGVESDAAPPDDGGAASQDTPQRNAPEESAAAEADTDAADTEEAPKDGESIHEYLVRQLSEDSGEDAGTDAEAETNTAANDDGTNTDEPANGESKELSTESEGEKPKEEADGGEDQTKAPLMLRDEIEEKFNRAPKALRDVAARNSEIVMELVNDLGGPSYIDPIVEMSKGLQEDNNFGVFSGMLKIKGVGGFTDFLKDAIHVALIETQSAEPTNEGEKYLQDACRELLTGALTEKYGEGVTLEYVEKLIRYDQEGHLNTEDVDKYYAERGEDIETVAQNPVFKRLKEENEELRQRLGEQSDAGAKDTKSPEKQHAEIFDSRIKEQVGKIFDDTYFAKSALRSVSGDSPDLAAAKQTCRELLTEAGLRLIQSDPQYKRLRSADKKGEANTADNQRRYANLTNTALLNIRQAGSKLENLISQIYTLSRNSTLLNNGRGVSLDPASDGKNGHRDANFQPTQTKKREKTFPSREEWDRHVKETLASMN